MVRPLEASRGLVPESRENLVDRLSARSQDRRRGRALVWIHPDHLHLRSPSVAATAAAENPGRSGTRLC